MVDSFPISRLITILPTQPVQGISQPPIAGSGGQLASLLNFPVGSVLSGFIVNRDAGGNPILRTASGDITFASNFFLKIGSEISIRVENFAGNTSAHILTVNGQPPEIATAQTATIQQPEVIISGNLAGNVSENPPQTSTPTNTGTNIVETPQTPQIISPNTEIVGKVIAPIVMQTATGETTPIIPAGTQISMKVVSVNVAQPIVTPPVSAAPPAISAAPSIAVAPPTIPTPTAPVITPQSPTQPVVIEQIIVQEPNITPPNTSLTPPPPLGGVGGGGGYNLPTQTENAILITPSTPHPNPPPQRGRELLSTIQSSTITQQPPITIHQPLTTNSGLSATILNSSPNGEATLQTPVGLVRVSLGVQLPAGTAINFEITKIQTPDILQASIAPTTSNITATTPAPITELARSAGALNDIFSLLTGLNTPDAQNFLQNNIPSFSPPANLPQQQTANFLTALLNFAAALKTGNFQEWLGQKNAKWLVDNGHENLLKKASSEFASLSRQFTNSTPQTPANSTQSQHWQSLFFPIAVDGQLQQARLFVKRDKEQQQGNNGQKTEEDTRFVLEMDLTHTGQMQMDGFVRRSNNSGAGNTQFDLVIRSHQPISATAQSDISKIYSDTGEITGYSGSINFQTTQNFPVNPMEEIISGQQKGVMA